MFRMRYKEDIFREAIDRFLAENGDLCGSGELLGLEISVAIDADGYPESASIELRNELRESSNFVRMLERDMVRGRLDWQLEDALQGARLNARDDTGESKELLMIERAAWHCEQKLCAMEVGGVIDHFDINGELEVGAAVEIDAGGRVTGLRLSVGYAGGEERASTIRLGGDPWEFERRHAVEERARELLRIAIDAKRAGKKGDDPLENRAEEPRMREFGAEDCSPDPAQDRERAMRSGFEDTSGMVRLAQRPP